MPPKRTTKKDANGDVEGIKASKTKRVENEKSNIINEAKLKDDNSEIVTRTRGSRKAAVLASEKLKGKKAHTEVVKKRKPSEEDKSLESRSDEETTPTKRKKDPQPKKVDEKKNSKPAVTKKNAEPKKKPGPKPKNKKPLSESDQSDNELKLNASDTDTKQESNEIKVDNSDSKKTVEVKKKPSAKAKSDKSENKVKLDPNHLLNQETKLESIENKVVSNSEITTNPSNGNDNSAEKNSTDKTVLNNDTISETSNKTQDVKETEIKSRKPAAIKRNKKELIDSQIEKDVKTITTDNLEKEDHPIVDSVTTKKVNGKKGKQIVEDKIENSDKLSELEMQETKPNGTSNGNEKEETEQHVVNEAGDSRTKHGKQTKTANGDASTKEGSKKELKTRKPIVKLPTDDMEYTRKNSFDIVQYLTDETWKTVLGDEIKRNYFKALQDTLGEIENKTFFPPSELIFNAFNLTPLSNIKVVILGQDPYHDDNQACGVALSVQKDSPIPKSLKTIYKELSMDIEGFVAPDHGCLESWAKNGVFLLNTILTVLPHSANSHSAIGWKLFTDAVIKIINEKCEHVVFMFWGKEAQLKSELIDEKKHLILKAVHPSSTAGGKFNGCKHFSQANTYLKENGREEINWKLE